MKIVHDQSGLTAIYESCLETPFIKYRLPSKEECFFSWGKLDVLSFIDQEHIGGVMFDSHKVHIAIKSDYYGKCEDLINKSLEYGMSKYRFLIGEVHHKNLLAIEFVKRMKFKEIKHNGQFIFFLRTKHV